MSYGQLMDLEQITQLINEGKSLLIAGDESILEKIPKGNWIGGTIPYFMSEQGGLKTSEKAFVNIAPNNITNDKIIFYNSDSVKNVYKDAYENGFSVIIIPANSKTHLNFAMYAPKYEDFATVPLIGWISGIDLADIGKKTAKIFNGKTGEKYGDGAIVYHFDLPDEWAVDLHIINIFSQGNGDTIKFPETGFTIKDAIINGDTMNFARYLKDNNVDIKFPLVANYEGAMINVSFQNIDEENGTVNLYAPVFKGVEYKQAGPKNDYVHEFEVQLEQINNGDIPFSCNCILNFVYGELEGKRTGSIVGPITFGEIAYQLVNQTLVYLELINLEG